MELSQLRERCALIVFGDAHMNHVYGLGPPTFRKDSGDEVKSNPARKALMRYWDEFVGIALESTEGWPRVAVSMGDMLERDAKHRNSNELISTNPDDALRLASGVLDPLMERVDASLFIRGTEAHAGQSAWGEENLARQYDHAIVNPETRQSSWWNFYGYFGGVLFDISHHGSLGSVPRNVGGYAARLGYDIEDDYIKKWDAPVPDVGLRAHSHRWADGGTTYGTRVFFIPCFQLVTAFGHRINVGWKKPDIGGVVLFCENGNYDPKLIRVRQKRRVPWKP